MIKKIFIATIVLLPVFILGCSEISELIESLAHTPSAVNPEITTKIELGSKWQMSQMKIKVGADDELSRLLKLADGDKVDGYSYVAYYIDDAYLAPDSVNQLVPGATATKTFAWKVQSGSHAIKAIADSNKSAAESNETNNAKTIALSTPAPDLTIKNITWSPAYPSIGDIVTFTVTIKNQGSSEAGSSYVAYYIDDAYLTSAFVNQLVPGATATKTFSWKAQAGSHIVKAIADSNEEVTESDESNNVKTFAFSTLAPDLIIEEITWSPENPSTGDIVTFSLTIKNQGDKRTRFSRVYFYIDGFSRGYQDVQRIDADATVINNFTWKVQAGSHVIKAVADGLNHITESDETNNEKAVIYSTLAPDLIIEEITWSPKSPVKDETVTFSVTMKNQGIGKTYYSHIAYYIDDAYLTSVPVSPLNPGDTVTKTFTWKAQIDSHIIKAVADPHKKVTESDETNNEKTVTFSGPSIADLIIQAVTWSPASPSIGDTVTFTATIKNQGGSRADSSRVHFYIDGSSRGYQDIQGIAAGATLTKTFIWAAQAGSHTVKAWVDIENQITESDENNNEKTVTFSGPSRFDLIVQDITWSPASPSVGDTVTFTVTIKNQGSDRADYSYVAYYIDDAYLTSAHVKQIAPGATDNNTFSLKAQAGSHAIKVVADSNKGVIESDENNNAKTVTFATLAPDLIIETITWSPASPSIGDTVTFTVSIKNQGSDRANHSYVAYYIDGFSRGYHSIQEIGASATVTKTFTWTAQAGSPAIKAIADSNNEVTESDETNNAKTVTFSDPDLIIQTITWSPAHPSIDDAVTFSVTIKNHGGSRVGSSRVYFYIDGSSRGYQDVQEINAGATVTKTFTWNVQAGSHDIKAVADFNNEVSESDEANNAKTVTFSIFLSPAPTSTPASVPTPTPTPTPAPKPTPKPMFTPAPAIPETGITWWVWLIAALGVISTTFTVIWRLQHRNVTQISNGHSK